MKRRVKIWNKSQQQEFKAKIISKYLAPHKNVKTNENYERMSVCVSRNVMCSSSTESIKLIESINCGQFLRFFQTKRKISKITNFMMQFRRSLFSYFAQFRSRRVFVSFNFLHNDIDSQQNSSKFMRLVSYGPCRCTQTKRSDLLTFLWFFISRFATIHNEIFAMPFVLLLHMKLTDRIHTFWFTLAADVAHTKNITKNIFTF